MTLRLTEDLPCIHYLLAACLGGDDGMAWRWVHVCLSFGLWGEAQNCCLPG